MDCAYASLALVLLLGVQADPVDLVGGGPCPSCVEASAGKRGKRLCDPSDPTATTDCVKNPRRAKHVPPRYPEKARLARQESCIRFRVTVTEKGKIKDIRLEKAEPPNPILVKAARKAVKKWRYHPATKKGKPIAVSTCVIVDFKLK